MLLVTWNVQGMARAWRRRRATIVRALEPLGPDVVALQECAWRIRHQSAQLGAALGMGSARSGTLGLLTKSPPTASTMRLPADAKGGSKRALLAQVDGIHIAVVHFPLDSGVRASYAARLAEWARSRPGPALVCGDANERPDGAAMTLLRERGFIDAWTQGEGFTWPAPAPRARIDVVLLYGNVRVQQARLIAPDPPASDHLAVAVSLVAGTA